MQEAIDAVRAFGHDRLKLAKSPGERMLVVQVVVVVVEYVRHYWHADVERFNTQDVEGEIVCDVVNPATGRASPIFDHASKLDGLAFDRFAGEQIIIEHKSTTDGLEVWSPYWRKLVIDSQVSKYLLSVRQSGIHGIRRVLYDVVTKPGTKPKDITKSKVPAIAESGQYCGFNVTDATAAAVRAEYDANKGAKGGFTGKMRESLELYGLRLRRMIVDSPDDWFARKTITRTDDELKEYAGELWALARELREARAANVWPKNSTHCSAYGSLCEFFAVCCDEKDIEGDGFVVADWVHDELAGDDARSAPKGGRDLLTNSRLTTLQSCKRRHLYRYEMGLRKEEAGDVSSVALFWGSLFHDLLEIVWNFYAKDGGNNG
jgi:hypothetical protein